MLGSSVTQQLFASANSIAVIPQVNAEWNYNSFLQPYVVTSHSASQILPANFNSTASWSIAPVNSVINGAVTATASGIGITALSDPTASALYFTINKKIENNTGSASGLIASRAESKFITLASPENKGLFYKFIFYVKVANTTYTDGFPNLILGSTVSKTVSSAGTKAFNYRVVGIGSNGQTLGPDINNNTDLVTALSTGTGSITLSWTTDRNAAAYRIYRSFNSNDTSFRSTTAGNTFVDDLSACVSESFAPATFSPHINISPQIVVNGDTASAVQVAQYIKSTNNSTGQLERNIGSIEAVPDVWKRVEIWFGTPADSNIKISQVKLVFDMVTEHESAAVMVDNIELYQITEHDFFLNDYFPTESIFKPYRPGEALLNNLLPSSDRAVNKFTTASSTRPVSYGIKSPQIYVAKEYLSPKMQILPSTYDKFKYYISDAAQRSIQAQYNSYLSVNKIVLKYDATFNSIASGSVTLYTGATNTKTVLQLGSASFNSNGLTTLYYDGTGWSTSSWSSPPRLTASGTLQNVLTQVRGISFTAGSMTTNTNFSSGFVDNSDFAKLHIIELSPRLEIDISDVLEGYNIQKDLTAGNTNGFPLSYINSNGGSIELSNIPFYQTSGYGATIFENLSKNATFYGLMRQGVKFSGFLKNTSFSTDLIENVPQFVMYANSWDINDIGNVSVELFDITKLFAQTTESPAYFAQHSDLFTIVTTMFNIVGFSDYDYDSLKNICATSTRTTNFWYDESKTIFQNIQDLFIVHQIGAFIDEYGVLRFKSLSQIFNQFNNSNFSADLCITDVSSSVSPTTGSVRYISNIIPDSYHETISEKIGKIIAKFKIARDSNSTDVDQQNQNNIQANYNTISDSKPAAWTGDAHYALPSFALNDDLNVNDNYMYVNPAIILNNPRTNVANFEGDLFVGNEIVGYSGMEYVFYPTNNNNIYVTKIVRSGADIDEGVNAVKNISTASNVTSVRYNTTGRFVGLQRGKYGTPISNHRKLSDSLIASTFDLYSYYPQDGSALYASAVVGAGSTAGMVKATNQGMYMTAFNKNQYMMLAAKSTNVGQNLYAIDFSVPTAVKTSGTYGRKTYVRNAVTGAKLNVSGKPYTDQHDLAVGIFFNMDAPTVYSTNFDGATHFIEIFSKQEYQNYGDVKYYLSLYAIINNQKTSLISTNPISINNVFDGEQHRLAVFVNAGWISVAIDNKVVLQSQSRFFKNLSGRKFGAYVRALEDQGVKIGIDEIYADTVLPIDGNSVSAREYPIESRYYFFTKNYLNNIVNNIPNYNPSFLFQGFPQVRGIKIYDVKHSTAPIYAGTAEIIPVEYGSQAVASETNAQAGILGPIIKNDLMYSDLNTNPFRSKFAVVNNTNQLVYLEAVNSENTHVPIHILAKHQKLTDEQTIERVVDPNQTLSVEMQTDWVSSRAEIEKILDMLARTSSSFYNDLTISVFGNPLVQVGDFVKLTYSLKRLGYDPADSSVQPVICLVTSVSQGFSGGVSDTNLVLKPIITA